MGLTSAVRGGPRLITVSLGSYLKGIPAKLYQDISDLTYRKSGDFPKQTSCHVLTYVSKILNHLSRERKL